MSDEWQTIVFFAILGLVLGYAAYRTWRYEKNHPWRVD